MISSKSLGSLLLEVLLIYCIFEEFIGSQLTGYQQNLLSNHFNPNGQDIVKCPLWGNYLKKLLVKIHFGTNK